jgi:hypothetical protein
MGDRHVILWSEATNELVEGGGYTDYYQPGVFPPVAASSPTPSCLSVTTFDTSSYVLPLTSNGRACGQTAARLPIAPFFFTYADIVEAQSGTGDLGHMLGWTAHEYRTGWQWPARETDGAAATGLTAGTVIRLKADADLPYDPTTLSADEQVIVRTLQRYGMCLYDKNASSANIAMPCDPDWPNYPNQIDLTDTLRLSDFELVDISPLRYDPSNINNIRVVNSGGGGGGFQVVANFEIAQRQMADPELRASFIQTCTPGNSGTAGIDYQWTFGDGSAPITVQNGYHTYSAAGTYTVSLYIYDPLTGTSDTISKQVTVPLALPPDPGLTSPGALDQLAARVAALEANNG